MQHFQFDRGAALDMDRDLPPRPPRSNVPFITAFVLVRDRTTDLDTHVCARCETYGALFKGEKGRFKKSTRSVASGSLRSPVLRDLCDAGVALL